MGSGLSSVEHFWQVGDSGNSEFVVFDIRNFSFCERLEKKSRGRVCGIVKEKQKKGSGSLVRRLSREVRHIIRQNGCLIEEIIAIRNGRLVKYVKKDSRGRVTCGSYRMANKQATEQTEKISSAETSNKEGLLDAILKVMIPARKQNTKQKKENA